MRCTSSWSTKQARGNLSRPSWNKRPTPSSAIRESTISARLPPGTIRRYRLWLTRDFRLGQWRRTKMWELKKFSRWRRTTRVKREVRRNERWFSSYLYSKIKFKIKYGQPDKQRLAGVNIITERGLPDPIASFSSPPPEPEDLPPPQNNNKLRPQLQAHQADHWRVLTLKMQLHIKPKSMAPSRQEGVLLRLVDLLPHLRGSE